MLSIHTLSKSYGATRIFHNVSLELRGGEFVALLGESGVGKSTLLNCIAGLDDAQTGSVAIAGVDLARLDDNGRALLRRQKLGFVFQAFHVLPHLSVAQTVSLPLRLQGRPHEQRVAEVLQAVGLEELASRMPAQLSGGQLQRVAIARAVVHQPGLILADEPTGNLDPDTAQRVMALLRQQVQDTGAACLLVTHSRAAAAAADRVLRLHTGGVSEAQDSPEPAQAAAQAKPHAAAHAAANTAADSASTR